MTDSIQVYARGFTAQAENQTTNITLTGIDPDQILNEFSIEERLDSIDLGEIADYLTRKQEDSDDEDYSMFGMTKQDMQKSLDSLTIRRPL